MCTVVLLRRSDHAWPLLLAANRDEMIARPWKPPGRHWSDRPEVTAGIDELAGGTWLGLNDTGVVAAILNGRRSLGPQEGFRTRGELPLEALDHADAKDAVEALASLDPEAYRTFHLVIADNRDAFMVSVEEVAGKKRTITRKVPDGLSLVTSAGLNAEIHPRTRLYLPQFRATAEPDPENGDWSAWTKLLASRAAEDEAGHEGAMEIVTDTGYGTVSSSLVALPAIGAQGKRPIYLFRSGRPGEGNYVSVTQAFVH